MKVSAYLSEKKEHLILITVLIWIVGIVLSFFYVLSYLVTPFGSLFLFLAFLVFLMHLGTRIATFPGAYFIWLRIIERNNLKTISSQTCKRLEILTLILLLIKDSNFKEIYERLTLQTLSSLPKCFERILRNLRSLKSLKLSQDQDFIFEHLSRLVQCLKEIKFFANHANFDLYSFLMKPSFLREIKFLNTDALNEALQLSEVLYNVLRDNFKETASFKDLVNMCNFKAQVPLGSIDYMRAEVLDKFQAEQTWVTSLDGTKIDCLWVPGSSSFTVIYCHPNGGFYEFISVQNEWVKFYLELGFNVMLWNYRGYGRTSGHPAMTSLAEDGESVFNYVKDVKNSEKVLVHGQSLGGSISCRLGKMADFILADRTFRSLTDVALFSYGKSAHTIYKLFGPSETDPVKDFISSSCYKLIASDPDDAMIPNLSSLKAGLILELTGNNAKGAKIFDLKKKFQNNQKFQKLVQDLNQVHKFKTCKDDESPKVDILGSLCSLEVHGRNLYKISKKKEKEIELIIWITSLKVWKEIEKEIRTTVDDLLKSLKDTDGCEELEILRRILKGLLDVIDDWELELVEDDRGPGKVITLHCGHNNAYQPYELYTYKSHLKAANMIPK